jgi:hypothetical protein
VWILCFSRRSNRSMRRETGRVSDGGREVVAQRRPAQTRRETIQRRAHKMNAVGDAMCEPGACGGAVSSKVAAASKRGSCGVCKGTRAPEGGLEGRVLLRTLRRTRMHQRRAQGAEAEAKIFGRYSR